MRSSTGPLIVIALPLCIPIIDFISLSKSITEAKKFHLNAALYHLIDEYDIIFHITDLSIPIDDNGVRETDKDYRLAIHSKINELLEYYNIPAKKIVKISGTTEERVNQVKASLA